MDHTELAREFGEAGAIALAVRDLASHGVLMGSIVPDCGARPVVAALEDLIVRWGVLHLRSPVRRSSYNGACEAGMRSLKEGALDLWRTDRAGDPAACVARDAELLNTMDSEPLGACPEEIWAPRQVVSKVEREALHLAVEQSRARVLGARRIATIVRIHHTTLASIECCALRDVLCETRYLTIQRP